MQGGESVPETAGNRHSGGTRLLRQRRGEGVLQPAPQNAAANEAAATSV
jgi:hypothetical protein